MLDHPLSWEGVFFWMKSVQNSKWTFQCSSLCTLPLPVTWYYREESSSVCLAAFVRFFWLRSCWGAFSPDWAAPDLSAFPCDIDVQSLNNFCCPLVDSYLALNIHVILEDHRADQCWVGAKDNYPWPAGNASTNAAWVGVGCWLSLSRVCSVGLWSVWYLPALQVVCQAAFQLGSSQHVLVHGIISPLWKNSAFPDVEFFLKFLFAHLSSLLRFLLMAVQRSGLLATPGCIICEVSEGTFCPSSRWC